jgi:hypothetical protein
MRVNVTHGTTRAEAKKKLRRLLSNLAEKHADVVSNVEERWEQDQLQFGFRARGIAAKGTVDVTDDEVIVEGRLPLLVRPFESRIKSAIEREAKSLFRKA